MTNINLDQAYCSSKNCQNKCGRKIIIPLKLKNELDMRNPGWDQRVWMREYCDDKGEVING